MKKLLSIFKARFIINLIFIFCFINLTGCKKLIEVDPPDSSINSLNIYTDDALAASVLTGIYTKLSQDNANLYNGSLTSISLFAGLSADELKLFDNNTRYFNYYSNSLTNIEIFNYWNTIYPIIYRANAALDGLQKSNTLTDAVKKQLIGEAKFFRAFCYFYLVNIFGDVPVALSTDYSVNATLTRSPKATVYQQIVNDLKDAQSLLNEKYLKGDAISLYASGSEERVRPTKAVATALLARVYLYNGEWMNAETEASKVIDNISLYGLEALSNVFKKNNKEAIWQLQAIGSTTRSNTGEGQLFILPSTGPSSTFPIYLSSVLVNSFENGDGRRTNWVGSVTPSPGTTTYYYPNKYKIGAVNTTTQEYCTVFRLGELYLIRAEARAQINTNINGAQFDLNAIRTRAGLPNTTANDKTSLLAAILRERQVELFTEWGHRWFDLKRTGSVDAVMGIVTPTKGGTWQTTDQLYPIPQSELLSAPQLTQNPGY
jgi:hypothetical protein